MSMRKLLLRMAAPMVVLGALILMVRLLGDVDYDTHPTAETPSRPTAPILNEADQALAEGARWAESNKVDSHQACQNKLGSNLKAMGCHRYVTAHKHIPPLANWRTQPTTRDCRAGVYAHWDPLLQDLAEQGENRAVASWTYKGLEPDLRECNNIDNVRIIQAVHEPLARIKAMLAHLRAGQALSAEELAQLRLDLPVVEGFREHDLRSQYLALADELFPLVGGRERVFPLARAGSAGDEQCAAMAEQVIRHKAAFHEALKEASGHNDSAQAVLVARQNELLDTWTQAADERLKAGCPLLR